MGNSEVAVRVVAGTEAVRDMLASLPAQMRRSAFHHPNWTTSWLATPSHVERKTIAVAVEEAGSGRPMLVLPLTLATFGGADYWAPLDHGVCDYNGSLSAPDFRPSAAEMRAIWKRVVAALPSDASFLLIDKLPTDIGAAHEALAEVGGLRPSHMTRHPLRLDADYAALRADRFCPTNCRSLDRKRRKLERKGRLAFTSVAGPEAVPLLDRVMTWRAERYDDQPVTTDFYRRLVERGDPARVMVLTLDEQPISAVFGLVEPTAFRLLAVGHDKAFSNWSPGLLVIEDAIRTACEAGLEEFDFTIGAEAYKFGFGVATEPLWLFAAEFGPHGSAMLRLMLTRNAIASRLKTWLGGEAPGGRGAEARTG